MHKLRLNVQGGSINGGTFELENGWIMAGRGGDASIRFHPVQDRIVSNQHAIFQKELDSYYVVDMNSRNGTFVNGNRVQKALLRTGDTIELGHGGPRLLVTLERVIQASPARPEMPAAPSQPLQVHRTVINLGFYNPEKDRGKTMVGIGAAILIGALMTLVVAVLMVLSLGPVGAFVGGLVAFIPAPIYLILYLWLDRFDPEPAWILTLAFSWGALVALLISFVVNSLFGAAAMAMIGEETGDALSAIISAPIIEEGTKGLGVLLIWLFFKREFDDVLDGVMYAGVVALGFATVENILYYGRNFTDQGVEGLIVVVIMRGMLSPFSHALFTSFTGIGCGLARETHNHALRWLLPGAGLFCAMTLHGLWNLLATVSGGLFLVVYFIVWLPLYIALLGLIIYLVAREGRIIRQMLFMEVASGLISDEHLRLSHSFFKRIGWLTSALGSWRRFQARRRFLRALTKLAFCYWHVGRAQSAQTQTISLPLLPKFRAEVRALMHRI